MTNESFRHLSELIINKTVVHRQWQYYDSFYFSTVVLALIGYGHRILITTRAKIFCIFYAMLGVPMWLITFQSAGERLNSLLSHVLYRVKQTLRMKQTKITDGELLLMESVLSVIILLIGAWVFSSHEKWSFFDAFYYGFITLTTIGFGDYVVLVSDACHSAFCLNFQFCHLEKTSCQCRLHRFCLLLFLLFGFYFLRSDRGGLVDESSRHPYRRLLFSRASFGKASRGRSR